MHIAVTSEGNTIDSKISNQFEECQYLLVINTDDMKINAIKNESNTYKVNLAYEVVKHDCEAIITGAINPKSFEILADAYVTRYYGVGHSVIKAIDYMDKNKLYYIKLNEGYKQCSGSHHH